MSAKQVKLTQTKELTIQLLNKNKIKSTKSLLKYEAIRKIKQFIIETKSYIINYKIDMNDMYSDNKE